MVTRLEMAARKSPTDRRIIIELLELRLGFEPEAAAPSQCGARTQLNLPKSARLTASCGSRQPVTTTPSKSIAE